MRSLTILYPGGNLKFPTTGGQVYDYRLFAIIKNHINDIQIIDDKFLHRANGESVLKLPLRLVKAIKALGKKECLIYNTALFPYYILPFFLLKILYPRLKLIGIHHHFRFQEQKGWKLKFYKFLEFLNLKQCNAIINPCPYTKDILLANWKNAPVISLENSFDISLKTISSFQKYKFIYVGSVYERKGIIYLLKAIAEIPHEYRKNIIVEIIGHADESSEYVKSLYDFVKAQNLGKYIRFRGRVSDKELREAYSSAYAFILPSLLEGYGLVIVEAMSYGLPVIAFNNSAMPYTIKDGINGLLAQDKNSQSLKDNILKLIKNHQLHKVMSNNAFATARKSYSIKEFEKDVKLFLKEWD